MTQPIRALGLMSGTSMDGIDAALIETDGERSIRSLYAATFPYDEAFREKLRACLGNKAGSADPAVAAVERELTLLHAKIVRKFLMAYAACSPPLTGGEPVAQTATGSLTPRPAIDLIGFHGHSLWHNPAARESVTIGDGALLAAETGIDVVNDLRAADVKAGGQGAPLLPLYHRALAASLPKPVAILNIGGVSNVTWIGGEGDDEILAFDTGPGNALIDDWVQRHTGKAFDEDGKLAAAGKVDEERLMTFLEDPYFAIKGPKSLDRNDFEKYKCCGLSVEDGAATLTMMTVQGIAIGLRGTGKPIRSIYLCGGGAHNATLRAWLHEATGAKIGTVDDLGWHGDALEAEGWAYLAVRSIRGLPLSLPGTTGVPEAMTGGVLHRAKR